MIYTDEFLINGLKVTITSRYPKLKSIDGIEDLIKSYLKPFEYSMPDGRNLLQKFYKIDPNRFNYIGLEDALMEKYNGPFQVRLELFIE